MTTVSRTISYRHTAGEPTGRNGQTTFTFDTDHPLVVVLDFGTDCTTTREVAREILARRVPGLMDATCFTDGMWFYLTLGGDGPTVTVRYLTAAVSAFLAQTKRLVPYGSERVDVDAIVAGLLGGAR